MEDTSAPARGYLRELPKLEALLGRVAHNDPGAWVSDEQAAKILGWSYGSTYRVRRGRQRVGMNLVQAFRRRFPTEPVDTISPALAHELAVLAATA